MTEPAVKAADMLAMADALSAVREVANGLRLQLEADGWSPTAAEQCAAAFFIASVTGTVGGGRK